MNWKSLSVLKARVFASVFAMLGALACSEGPVPELGADLTVEALACKAAPELEVHQGGRAGR